jgi:hypothetical protein
MQSQKGRHKVFIRDIGVIRAVHSDRIRRDITARARPEVAPRDSSMTVARRQVGRSIVRIGSRIAAEPAPEHGLDHALDLATSR